MIQTCANCHMKYLMSHYWEMCDYCGDEQESWLELREVDGVVEWWRLASKAQHGESEARERRWRIA